MKRRDRWLLAALTGVLPAAACDSGATSSADAGVLADAPGAEQDTGGGTPGTADTAGGTEDSSAALDTTPGMTDAALPDGGSMDVGAPFDTAWGVDADQPPMDADQPPMDADKPPMDADQPPMDVAGGPDGMADSGCVPDCGGMECGDNGCGGSCGTCTGGATCVEGTCEDPAATCPPGPPYGPSVGDTGADASLKDCDGNTVNLHELMCAGKATWILPFFGW